MSDNIIKPFVPRSKPPSKLKPKPVQTPILEPTTVNDQATISEAKSKPLETKPAAQAEAKPSSRTTARVTASHGFEFAGGQCSDQGWGSWSQIHGTLKELADLKELGGNQDGLWGNEHEKSGTTGGIIARQPLALRLKEAAAGALTKGESIEVLHDFVERAEEQWGQPVSNLDTASLKDGNLFKAQKAIMLKKMGLSPDRVTDFTLTVSGEVDGVRVPPRDMFGQYFSAEQPTGDVQAVSPGFLEGGKNFQELTQQFVKGGLEQVVFDHHWLGQTQGDPGEVEQGENIALETAAALAVADGIQKQRHNSGRTVLLANSMGAGPGGWGQATMADNGRVKLDPVQMPTDLGTPQTLKVPQGVDSVLAAPFLGATVRPFANPVASLLNLGIAGASHIPGLKELPMPAMGLPPLIGDQVGAQKTAQDAVLQGSKVQLVSMTAANPFIKKVLKLNQKGILPKGRTTIVQGDHDSLANPKKSQLLKTLSPERVELRMLPTRDHVLEQHSEFQKDVAQAVWDMVASPSK